MTIDVQIKPRPKPTPEPTTEIEFVPNLDTLSEADVCSCAVGDDNPF